MRGTPLLTLGSACGASSGECRFAPFSTAYHPSGTLLGEFGKAEFSRIKMRGRAAHFDHTPNETQLERDLIGSEQFFKLLRFENRGKLEELPNKTGV